MEEANRVTPRSELAEFTEKLAEIRRLDSHDIEQPSVLSLDLDLLRLRTRQARLNRDWWETELLSRQFRSTAR